MRQRGFTEEDASRNLSFFYQLRRAFYFIFHGLIGGSDCMKSQIALSSSTIRIRTLGTSIGKAGS